MLIIRLILVVLLNLYFIINLIAKQQDTSKHEFAVSLGYGSYSFSKYLVFGTAVDGLLFSGTGGDKLGQPNIAFRYNYKITKRKKIDANLFYCNSNMRYFYQTKDFNNNLLVEKYGNIDFNTMGLNTNINYKVYKFFSVHYGLNATYILREKIDDEAIGKRVNWLDSNGNSNLRKKLNFGLNFGFGISFLKRFKFEYNFTAGKTNFIYLFADNFNANYFTEKIRATSLTLSYKIN